MRSDETGATATSAVRHHRAWWKGVRIGRGGNDSKGENGEPIETSMFEVTSNEYQIVVSIGAGDGIRTRDQELGKLLLYQLSYARSGEGGDSSAPDATLPAPAELPGVEE